MVMPNERDMSMMKHKMEDAYQAVPAMPNQRDLSLMKHKA